MRHNAHEIPKAKAMAKALGMEFRPKQCWDATLAPVDSFDMIFRETGLDVSSAQYPPADRRMAVLPCLLLWHSPQINWDGRLLGCCVNTWQDFGNVFSDGLSACMDSERYQHTKKMLQGKAGPRDDIPCVRCPRFAGISKHPLRAQDLLLPL